MVQDAKIFNDTPLKTDKCFVVLTKLLYLLYQGESLNSKDATNVFFAVTKAFQSKDVCYVACRPSSTNPTRAAESPSPHLSCYQGAVRDGPGRDHGDQ